jgi:hypothetical protein
MIAFTSLMFKKNPAFQLAMALLIMFTAYALQVLHRPYMSMVERPEVIRLAAERGELPSINQAVINARKINSKRFTSVGLAGRTSGNVSDRKRTERAKAKAKESIVYFFNYNTVEMTLLGCGVLINLCGVMFSSSRFDEAYYESQQEFITFVAIFIVIFSVVYYVSVCISEIAAGTDMMKWIQWHLCCYCCPDTERIRLKNLRRRRLNGEEVVDPMDEFKDFGDIELAHNPMMHQGNSKAQKEAEDRAAALSEQLQEQNEQNLKMADMMRKAKKDQGSKKSEPRKRGNRQKKKKGRGGNKSFTPRKADLVADEGDDNGGSMLEMSLFSSNAVAMGTQGVPGAAVNTVNPAAIAVVQPASTVKPTSKWRHSLDQTSGKTYYYNRETNQTQWEKPSDL